MSRFSFGACALVMLVGCAAGGPDFDEPFMPGSAGAEPAATGQACRTEDDCAAFEQCVAGKGRYPVCVAAQASSPVSRRGPEGQPPPPAGLLEGAARFGVQARAVQP